MMDRVPQGIIIFLRKEMTDPEPVLEGAKTQIAQVGVKGKGSIIFFPR